MKRTLLAAWWVAALGLYLTVRGYHSLDGDQAYRLPLLLHAQDVNLYADDPFVTAVDAFNPHRGYLALLDLASRPLGLSFGLFALFTLTFAATCMGAARLARAVWPGEGWAVGVVATALFLIARAGNLGTNHLFEPILLDRLIGFALGWLAIAWAVKGEIGRPAVAIGLAAIIHPSVGLQLGGLLAASWLVWAAWAGRSACAWRRPALAIGLIAAAIVPGAWPAISAGRTLFDGLSEADFRLLGVDLQMAQHMRPLLWRTPQWCAAGAYVLLAAVALFDVDGRRGTMRHRFVMMLCVCLAGLAAAFVGVEVVGNLKLTVFQPFRMATVARGLCLVAIAGRSVRLWNRGGFWPRVRVMIVAAGLEGDWSFVVAAAFELACTIADANAFDRLPTYVRQFPAYLMLAYGLIFLSRHDTASGHRALLAAVVGAGLIWGVATVRNRRGSPAGPWRPRRWAIVAAACWAFPAAALVVETVGDRGSPLVAAMATRCRFLAIPTDDVERLAAWCREHTPIDSTFIAPPGPKTFRLWSQRAVAFNRAGSPYHAAGLKDWAERFRAHVGFEGTTDAFVRAYLSDRHGVESGYARLNARQLVELAGSQGADHVVAAADLAGDRLEPLHAEGRYAVYRVRPAPEAVARRMRQ